MLLLLFVFKLFPSGWFLNRGSEDGGSFILQCLVKLLFFIFFSISLSSGALVGRARIHLTAFDIFIRKHILLKVKDENLTYKSGGGFCET